MKTSILSLPVKNYVFQFLFQKLCEMELETFARFRKIPTVSLLWSKFDEIAPTSCKIASVANFFVKYEMLYIDNFMLINEFRHLSQKEALKIFCTNWS